VDQIINRFHYWLPAFLAFFYSVMLIEFSGIEVYSDYVLAALFIGLASSLISVKPIFYLMGLKDPKHNDVVNVFVREIFYKSLTLVISLTLLFVLNKTEQFIFFSLVLSVITILRISDTVLEYLAVKYQEERNQSKAVYFSKLLTFPIIMFGICYLPGNEFIWFMLLAAVIEFFIKVSLIMKLLMSANKYAEGEIFKFKPYKLKGSAMHSGQNVMGVVNKNFDVLILTFLWEGVAFLAPYLFVKQCHGFATIVCQPITNYIMSNLASVNWSKFSLFIMLYSSLLILSCEILQAIYQPFDYSFYMRLFYIIWVFSIIAAIFVGIIVKEGLFKWQFRISFIISIITILCLWLFVYDVKEIELLIYLRVFIITLSICLQLLVISKFWKKNI
jgi:hypothetical protein